MHLTASTVPSSPALGDVYVDSGDNKLKYYDGTGWVEAGGSGGGGTVTSVTASGVLASSGGNTPDVSLNIGEGLTTVSSSLTMNLDNGLEFNSGAVRAKAGDAIVVDGDGINVLTGTVSGAVMAADGVPHCDPDQKLEMGAGPVYNWTCVADLGITSETDPKVGTLTNTKWCTSDGTQVICNSDLPASGDVLIGGNTVASTMTIGTNSNHTLGLKTNNTTKMTILENGNVGIGTTNPSAMIHLQNDQAGVTAGMVRNLLVDSSALSRFSVETDTGTVVLQGNNSLFTPSAAYGQPSGASIWTASGSTGGLTIATRNASAPIIFSTASTARMRIDSAGLVGIATAVPTATLSFGGNAARTIWMERHTTNNTAGNNLTLRAGGATSAATDKNGGSLILSGGTATGTGASTISFQTATAQGSTSTSDNAPTTKMTILGNGSVGIGTASPQSALDVNGRIITTVSVNANALSAVTANFSNANFVRADGATAACGTLNITNTRAGGSYTVTIPNATTTCTTIQWNGSVANLKIPLGYAPGVTAAGVVYTFIDDGAKLWMSAVNF